jgi:hypothetical protein
MDYVYKVDRFEFVVKATKDKDGIRFNCRIPAYDIIFGAKTEEEIERKSKAIVKMWLKHYEIE